jgi:hypothetical protein
MALDPRKLAEVMQEIELRSANATPYSSWQSMQPVTNPVSDYSAFRPQAPPSSPKYTPLRTASGGLYELPAGPRVAPLNDLGSSGRVYAQSPNRAALPYRPMGELGPGTAARTAGTGAPAPLALGSGMASEAGSVGASTAARKSLLARAFPGVAEARANGGYFKNLAGLTGAGGAGSSYFGVVPGSALTATGKMATAKALGRGALGPALAGMAVGAGASWAGDKIMSSDGTDEAGADWYDAGQGLSGAGAAAPVSAGLGGLAVALGASGPVGWGIAGVGTLGYGIYSMFANDDDSTKIKKYTAAGAQVLDEFAAEQGVTDPEIVGKYASEYRKQLLALEDPTNKDARIAVMDQLQAQMAEEAAVQQAEQQLIEDEQQSQENLLSQQKIAMEIMRPYIDQFQTSNQMVDAAYASYGGGLAEAARATNRQMNDQLALAAAQEAIATPFVANQQQAYINQLEQQALARQLASQGAGPVRSVRR